jgi:hypothetical protein
LIVYGYSMDGSWIVGGSWMVHGQVVLAWFIDGSWMVSGWFIDGSWMVHGWLAFCKVVVTAISPPAHHAPHTQSWLFSWELELDRADELSPHIRRADWTQFVLCYTVIVPSPQTDVTGSTFQGFFSELITCV